MKATKLLLAAALFTSLAALSYAGPGPEYWVRMTTAAQDRAKAKTEAAAQPATEAPKDMKVCANCNCPAMKKS
jgi:hypothetical protein